MGIIHLPNGIGATAPQTDLALAKPLELEGNVWYVNSVGGDDANSGKNELAPLATLERAHTNASEGDMVVLQSSHTETLTSPLLLTKSLTIVGLGISDGKPMVKMLNDQAAGSMWTITSAFVQIHNVWFPTNEQACSATRVSAGTGDFFRMVDCYVESGPNDNFISVSGGMTANVVKDTYFISVATAASDLPANGFTAANNLLMEGVTFDAGDFGYNSTVTAMTLGTMDFIGIEGLVLKGADITVLEGSKGYINVQTATGGARVNWCDVTP